MKNVFLTILGLGFVVLSCTKKEKVIEKSTSDTIITESSRTEMPAANRDTMKISPEDSTSHPIDSTKNTK